MYKDQCHDHSVKINFILNYCILYIIFYTYFDSSQYLIYIRYYFIFDTIRYLIVDKLYKDKEYYISIDQVSK